MVNIRQGSVAHNYRRGEEVHAKGRSLTYAYPIAMSPIGSNYGFYCYRDDGGFCFTHFHSAYAARDFIARLTAEREYKWLADDKIVLDNGTIIKGERDDDLERAIEYQPSKLEKDWTPPEPYLSYIRSFLGETHIVVDRDTDGNLRRTQYNPETPPERIRPESAPRAPRKQISDEEKTARKKAKAKSGDYITISQICEKLGHEPSVCRGMLRKLKIEKPAHGWAWPPSEAEVISNKLRKLLK